MTARHSLSALFLLLVFPLLAEDLPAGYYDAIEGKKDSVLKTTLSNIIKGGTRYKYGTRGINEVHSSPYTWDGFLLTDTREDGSVWDMYSDRLHYMAPDTLGAVSIPDLEIEHCFPKGWWGGTNNDAYKDLHHLNPANCRANNNKSDCPPGYVPKADKYDNGVFRMGKNDAYGGFYVFEPCDEYKGDFARAYFYIATAYEDLTWVDKTSAWLSNTDWQEFLPWLRDVLLAWHRLDPVSEKELCRHDAVSSIQHNRNPFIDYPELAEHIWGNLQGQPVSLKDLVFTGSDDYELPVETLVSRALPATDVTTEGFTARWKDAGERDYTVDVFTLTETGRNDTLLQMPYFNKALVTADPQHFSATGNWGTTGTGKAAASFGNNSGALSITLSGITIPAGTRLVLRAMAPMKLNGTDGAELRVTADGVTVGQPVLTNDEAFYEFPLPEGTKQTVIGQGNGKIFNVQQLFLVSGDLQCTRTSLPGWPQTLRATEAAVVSTLHTTTPVWYSVTPQGLRESMPVCVSNNPSPATLADNRLETLSVTPDGVVKLPVAGGSRLYDLTGRLRCRTDGESLHLPSHGIWLIVTPQGGYKVCW